MTDNLEFDVFFPGTKVILPAQDDPIVATIVRVCISPNASIDYECVWFANRDMKREWVPADLVIQYMPEEQEKI